MKKLIPIFSIIAVFSFVSCDKATVTVNTDVCDTVTVSYQNHIVGIMSDNCISCHYNSAVPPGDLSIYADVKLAVDALGSSSLHERVFGVSQDMPYGGSPLSGCDDVMLRHWISEGAPNN